MTVSWKERAKALKREAYALYFACRDPRVPWYSKALAGFVVAYAISPIDLIPDFIPVIGYLDDLILVPLGIMAVRAMVPAIVMEECRVKAEQMEEKPTSLIAACVIVVIWIGSIAATIYWLWPLGT